MSKSDKQYVVINYYNFYDNDYVFIRGLKRHLIRTRFTLSYYFMPFSYFGTIRFLNNDWYLFIKYRKIKLTDLVILDCVRSDENEK